MAGTSATKRRVEGGALELGSRFLAVFGFGAVCFLVWKKKKTFF